MDVIDQRPGTYKFINDLDEVDLTEWDAIVTDSPLIQYFRSSAPSSGPRFRQHIPKNLFVFHIFRPSKTAYTKVVDNITDASGNNRWLQIRSVPGSQISAGTVDLDPYTDQLRDALLLVASTRDEQIGATLQLTADAHDSHPTIEVLAFGPSNVMLAGRYRHIDGGAVWFVPEDITDFTPWWDAALRHWHTIDSDKFPDLPGWVESYDWLTYEERSAVDAIADEEERFAAVQSEHRQRMEDLQSKAANATDSHMKALLTATGAELQNAVRDVLCEFGYDVLDMDKKYPAREPREDYRITDPDLHEWLAIGDATGIARGAKSAKVMALARYAAHFEREEKPPFIPRQWLLVNRMIAHDPTARGAHIYRDDDREQLTAAPGLAIDTPALFILHRAMRNAQITGKQIRAFLRERAGELTIQDASTWIENPEV
ncbi:hypothetical protein J2W54_004961 [Rhodococcus fascians]|uniref:hypothetical protein n=1 Tax=Nocardiaceae TaxID=85025 RepID=UPI002858DBC5|nr:MULTISPECIES: hypothetical protein [Rhodococcus]MDR6912948.1 hypothetical protein [Rhodococcus sp. 3258]MDR6934545.1 hypothetical protein [Rhodococcus fascians]